MKKPYKIYHIVTSIGLGGSEIVATSIGENIQSLNEHIYIEIFSSKNNYCRDLKKKLKNNVITLSTFSKRLSLFFAPFSLFLFLFNKKNILIHSHTDLPDFVLSVVLRLRKIFFLGKIKIIRTIHNTELWPSHKRLGRFVEKTFKDDYVVGVSKTSLNAYIKLRHFCKLNISNNTQIIFNGISPAKNYTFNVKNKNKLNIVFCGRLEGQKGIDVLIRFLKNNNNSLLNIFDFYIIGEGSYKSEIVDLSGKFQNIHYVPSILSFRNHVNSFDFLIVPSRFEGFGLVSAEASFAGVNVIISNNETLKETLPNNWPLVFDLNSEDSLLNLLNNISAKKYDFNSLRKNALDFVESNFTLKHMLNGYRVLYNQLIITN